MINDPFILLSQVNTKLRNQYANLDDLCDDLDWDRSELEEKLRGAGFEYVPEVNQFK